MEKISPSFYILVNISSYEGLRTTIFGIYICPATKKLFWEIEQESTTFYLEYTFKNLNFLICS